MSMAYATNKEAKTLVSIREMLVEQMPSLEDGEYFYQFSFKKEGDGIVFTRMELIELLEGE